MYIKVYEMFSHYYYNLLLLHETFSSVSQTINENYLYLAYLSVDESI